MTCLGRIQLLDRKAPPGGKSKIVTLERGQSSVRVRF